MEDSIALYMSSAGCSMSIMHTLRPIRVSKGNVESVMSQTGECSIAIVESGLHYGCLSAHEMLRALKERGIPGRKIDFL